MTAPTTRTPHPHDANDAPHLPPRILVHGTTGSGKTTLGKRIAGITGAPYVELDALHWEPNWVEAPVHIFRNRVAEAIAGPAWVVDGNYSIVQDLTWASADAIIWLDYSIARIYWQLLKRTISRAVRREELWAGNREKLRMAFASRDSLFVWALKSHWKKRRVYPERLAEPRYAHLRVTRIRSPRELERFLSSATPSHHAPSP